MKAIVYTKYGPPEVLQFKEIEKPTPKGGEILIKIHAASLNAADWRFMRAKPFLTRFFMGLFKPKHQVLGADVAGLVEAVGQNAKQFKPGDEVFGDILASGLGAFAQYVCVDENTVVLKPANLTFEEAAAVPLAGITALQALRDKGQIQAGKRVLIHGAGGGVGTFAVQVAKSFGAEVSAVCGTRNTEVVRSIGADHVIDYTKEDFTKSGERYDLIFAANGNRSIFEYRRALNPGGIYVCAGGSMAQIFQALLLGPWISIVGSKKLGSMEAKTNQKDLLIFKELLENEKVTPVIDRRYPLSQTPEAIGYLEEGHARGKVVITVEH